MHEKVIFGVFGLTHQMNFSGGTGNSGYTGSSQQRIDFFFKKKIHNFSKNDPGGGCDTESHGTKDENTHRFWG